MSMTPGNSTRPHGFLHGAMMIALAGLVTRVLGAIYKPIVARLFAPYDGHMGDAGLGLVQIPAPAYLIILSVSAVGINIAISRLIAERLARGQEAAAERVFRVSLYLMSTIGLVLAGLFFLSAPQLARWAGRPETATGFQAIAPAIFVVSVMAAYRGAFQGRQEMGPYAVSQILEQLLRIGVGIALVYWLAPSSVPLGAAGYNFGPAMGALAGLGYLAWQYHRYRRHADPFGQPKHLTQYPGELPDLEPAGRIVRRIFALSIPISIVGAVEPLMMLVDSMLVINRLEASGISDSVADMLLGQLGNSYSLIMLPPILTYSLYVSLIPAITESLTLGQRDQARQRAATAYRLTLLFGLPATAGLWMLSGPIYKLFFLGDGGRVLAALALATLLLMLQQVSAGILQGMGDIRTPVLTFAGAFLVKVALTYWLTGIDGIGVSGAAYATVAAYGMSSVLNLLAVRWRMGKLVGLLGSWVKPGAATAVMAVLAVQLQPICERMVGSQRLAVLITIACAGLAYAVVLVGLRGLRSRDLDALPRIGPRVARWLRRWNLLMDV